LIWKAETKLDTKNLEYLKKLAEEEKKVKVINQSTFYCIVTLLAKLATKWSIILVEQEL
jgi:hypothetical protein